MATYERNPSLVGEIQKIRRRVASVENKTLGTFTYSTLDDVVLNSGSGTTDLVTTTLTTLDDTVVEVWANVQTSFNTTSSAVHTTITVEVDGVSQTLLQFSQGSAALRRKTDAGTIAGSTGTAGGFVVAAYNLGAGDHTVVLKGIRASGGGTTTVQDQYYAVRQG